MKFLGVFSILAAAAMGRPQGSSERPATQYIPMAFEAPERAYTRSSSYNNPFTIYLTMTNEYGVVTGMPSVVTSQPKVITSQPQAAYYSWGADGRPVVMTPSNNNVQAVQTPGWIDAAESPVQTGTWSMPATSSAAAGTSSSSASFQVQSTGAAAPLRTAAPLIGAGAILAVLL